MRGSVSFRGKWRACLGNPGTALGDLEAKRCKEAKH